MSDGASDGRRPPKKAHPLAALFDVDLAPPTNELDPRRTQLLPSKAPRRSPSDAPVDALLDDTVEEISDVRRPADPLIGARLETAEHSLVVRSLLGRGSSANVYAARDEQANLEVAVKVLRHDAAWSSEARRRLAREVALLDGLEHPNVVRVHGSGETSDGRPFIVMERIDGPTLRAELERGALPPLRALHIALDVASGLQVAHDRGVLHRDLKPANVMLGRALVGRGGTREVAKLVDFGCARVIDAPPGQSILTAPGGFLGTPSFAAPEQVTDAARVDARADLYALGGILYAVIVGRPPFAGDPIEVLTKKQRERPPPPPEAEGLGPIAELLLSPNADDRPNSARDVIRLLELLDLAVAETELDAPEDPGPASSPEPTSKVDAGRVEEPTHDGEPADQRTVPVARSSPHVGLTLAVAALVLVAAFGLALWLGR